jgi:hypothetical protein
MDKSQGGRRRTKIREEGKESRRRMTESWGGG